MLRDYQQRAVEELCEQKSCIYQLVTGGGKSLIIREIAERHKSLGRTVTVLTHRRSIFNQLAQHGINVVMVQQRAPLLSTDVIISDECHHAMSLGWMKKIQMAAPEYNYGFTATPWRMDGKGLKGIYENMVLGPSMRELIDRGYLSPYKYIAPVIAMRKLKTKGGDYDTQDAGNYFTSRKLMGDVLETWRKHQVGRTIGFACTVSHASAMVAIFKEAGISAEYIAGSRTAKENEIILKQFRDGQLKVMWSVDMVSEGFDVSECEAVILARPTQSLSLFLQQIGRVMRPSEGRTALILDHANNVRRHGMPCAEHNWTLDGEDVSQRKKRMAKKSTRTCHRCHAINYIDADVCICCGHKVVKPPPVVSTSANVAMDEYISSASKDSIPAWVLHYKKIGYAGLLRVAEQKGYKPGWAYFQKLNAFNKYGVEIK